MITVGARLARFDIKAVREVMETDEMGLDELGEDRTALFIITSDTTRILTYKVATRKGDRNQYIDGLEDVKELLKGHKEPVVLHTDQGSVYASMAYNEIIKDTVIVRSMSRAGKPTDNPVNESINGWMKEELYMDFKIDECRRREEFMEVLEKYVDFYNKHRPCYALGYDTPVNYRKRFFKGELERKNTFENRVLSEEPKFVQKRREQAHSRDVSTFDDATLKNLSSSSI